MGGLKMEASKKQLIKELREYLDKVEKDETTYCVEIYFCKRGCSVDCQKFSEEYLKRIIEEYLKRIIKTNLYYNPKNPNLI